MRYKFVKGSQSGHCCFKFTVVDATQPVMIHGEQYEDECKAICECFDEADAELICAALNAKENVDASKTTPAG